MKIGILSDTHLNRPTEDFKATVGKIFRDVDTIIHAGDMTGLSVHEFLSNWDLRAVAGNMDDHDLRTVVPEKRIEQIAGKRIGIMHGRGSAFGLEHLVLNEFEGVDIIVFGHSHIPVCLERGGVHLINPGSYRTGRTVGILELGDEIRYTLVEIE